MLDGASSLLVIAALLEGLAYATPSGTLKFVVEVLATLFLLAGLVELHRPNGKPV